MAERKAPARKPKATASEPAAKAAPKKEAASAEPHPTGYVGDHTDPTPNEHYTLSGVIAGKPIPEHEKSVG